ncbi:MAG: enoyl-CoA hydratase/isomerase family protein [Acidobacteria bacterium]|nr:enoyl-CoA hydratase/isomerase family protein [Acidobacteriota bacterium]
MDEVLVERRGHVTVFTMNRPEKRNAHDLAMMEQLEQGFSAFDDDPEQWVAIVTGAGDVAFSAGGDLKRVAAEGASAGRHGPLNRESTDLFGIGSSPKPVIAAVNGLAVGGGMEIALNCDIRIASENAWFGLTEPRHAMIAGVGVHLLPRMVSLGDALYTLLTSDRIPAQEAHRMGLVQRVVPSGELLDEAMRAAEMICLGSQVAVRATKRIVSFHRRALTREAIDLSHAMHELLYLSDDSREGPLAFAEKRQPNFTHRWLSP